MKKFIKTALAVIVQLVLLSSFDYFFIVHSVGVGSVYCWWFFAAYNLVAISAVIMSVVLRHMDDVKLLPSTVLTITTLISFLFSTISVIMDYQNIKFSIISALGMVIINAVAETTMYVIQHYRCGRTKVETEAQQSDFGEYDEDDTAGEVKTKIKSSALLLLMTYVTDLKKWDNLSSMPFLDDLICVVTDCRQYTYEELRGIEEEIKVQTNALKTYTNNNSVERATATANRIVNLLDQREEELDRIENEV